MHTDPPRDAAREPQPAFVDQASEFHCPCGATHKRGPVNGVDVYRCFKCGKSYRVRDIVELRGGRYAAREVLPLDQAKESRYRHLAGWGTSQFPGAKTLTNTNVQRLFATLDAERAAHAKTREELAAERERREEENNVK